MKKIAAKKKIIKKPAKKISVKKPVKKSIKKPVKKIAGLIKRKPAKKAAVKAVKTKASVRKPLKKPVKIKRSLPVLEGVLVGKITHFFPKVNAAVVKLQVPLAVGDTIKVKGHTTDFTQKLASIQIDRASVPSAQVGDIIGIQVKSRVRRGDLVTKL